MKLIILAFAIVIASGNSSLLGQQIKLDDDRNSKEELLIIKTRKPVESQKVKRRVKHCCFHRKAHLYSFDVDTILQKGEQGVYAISRSCAHCYKTVVIFKDTTVVIAVKNLTDISIHNELMNWYANKLKIEEADLQIMRTTIESIVLGNQSDPGW